MRRLEGHVAVVTGAARGIGRAIAERLAEEGAAVVLADIGEAGREVADGIGEAGGRAVFVPTDVTRDEDLTRMLATAVDRFGGLDVVVNNAGIGTFAHIADMTPAQWAEVIDTNVTGVFNVCNAALPALRQRGGGYIFNISSLAGKNPFIGAGAYCASKAALNQFSEVLNQEIRHDNIKVTTIAPGSVATAFAGGDEAHGADWKIATADIGELVIDLLVLDTRSLPSYIELRPSKPPKK